MRISLDIESLASGVWKPHPRFDGVHVCVTSTRNDAYQERHRYLENLQTASSLQKAGDVRANYRRIQTEAAAALLKDWKGVTADKILAGLADCNVGDEVPFDPDLAQRMAKDRRFDPFFEGVWTLGENLETEEMKAEEEHRGN